MLSLELRVSIVIIESLTWNETIKFQLHPLVFISFIPIEIKSFYSTRLMKLTEVKIRKPTVYPILQILTSFISNNEISQDL